MSRRSVPSGWRRRRLLGVFAIGIAWAFPSEGAPQEAQAAEPTYELSIRSQPLGDALQAFAKQSGIQIVFFSQLTEGLHAPQVQGKYTLPAAMAVLLSTSKLTSHVVNERTVEIRPAPANAPVMAGEQGTSRDRPAQVAEQKQRSRKKRPATADPMEEVIVTGTAEGLVATRTETPLIEIPQTVSIISHEQLRQQNDGDLSQALGHAAGITLVRTNSLDQRIYSRGFQVTSFHIDGGRALDSYLNSDIPFLGAPDLSEFDHIEVLRGADALFGGNGNPGGTVNMVRKRPLGTGELNVSAATGSQYNYRVDADATGPLVSDGALRGRLDASYVDRNYFYDKATLDRRKVFGALEYDLAPATLLTAGGSYQLDDAVPIYGGLPLLANGRDSRLPRDSALTFDWAQYKTRRHEVYLRLRQEFADDWRLTVNATQRKAKIAYAYGFFSWPVDPMTHSGPAPSAVSTMQPNTHAQVAADATLTGQFDLFGRHAEVATGADFMRVDTFADNGLFTDIGPRLADVYAYDPAAYPDPRATREPILRDRERSTTRLLGFFASLRVHLDDDWSIVGGARASSDRISGTAVLSGGGISFPFSADISHHGIVTPFAGVTYELNDHYSFYASYASVYQAFSRALRVDGSTIDQPRGANIEAGIKGAWRNATLNGALAYYRIAQRNFPIPDNVSPRPANTPLSCCAFTGVNRSEGADLELSGALSQGWLVGAGYSYNTNEAATGGVLVSTTPRHLFKLWTSRQLGGSLGRWTVGGSVHAQTSNFQTGSTCDTPSPLAGYCFGRASIVNVVQGGYAVVDLRAAFQASPNWEVSVTVNNLFDRTYYETLGGNMNNNWYGEPRGVLLRVDGRY